ncbi:MAG: hypothetical protein KF861_13155, partial [Planctomycetaceae bacterium]|nr:hypothetical protein [Planctomycetaceae bacterium]
EFAPLVAMLLNEAEGQHPVDFLNPRRPPRAANRRKVLLSAAAGIAALIAGAMYYVNGQFAEIDDQNAALVARRNELKNLAKEIQPKLRLASAIETWENSRISWLDELRDLTLRMPSNRDLTIRRFSASPSRGGSATVTFSGESRAPDVVARMEQSLRDKHHLPKTPGVRERPAQDQPVWTFQTTMTVTARPVDDYTAHLPTKTPQSAVAVRTESSTPAANKSGKVPPSNID